MILDTLDNIDTYKNLSNDLYPGLQFLKRLEPGISLGSYLINDRVKVIVEEYQTESNKVFEFESHKRVIDIQYAILGMERVFWSPIKDLDIKTPYNKKRDCTIFVNPPASPSFADIGNSTFAIMFENDGHSPKHCVDVPQLIKKITVKVSVN
jgi:YhcH/YjgK/YiaL family protein